MTFIHDIYLFLYPCHCSLIHLLLLIIIIPSCRFHVNLQVVQHLLKADPGHLTSFALCVCVLEFVGITVDVDVVSQLLIFLQVLQEVNIIPRTGRQDCFKKPKTIILQKKKLAVIVILMNKIEKRNRSRS